MARMAAASTTTTSRSARPSIFDHRASQHTFPTVRISFTPGAAVCDELRHVRQRAESSRGPGSAGSASGTRVTQPRCASASRRPRRGVHLGRRDPTGSCSNNDVRLPLASTSTSSTRRPRSAARSAHRGGDRARTDPSLAGEEEAGDGRGSPRQRRRGHRVQPGPNPTSMAFPSTRRSRHEPGRPATATRRPCTSVSQRTCRRSRRRSQTIRGRRRRRRPRASAPSGTR